jgi:hypothetical protein
LRDSAAYEVPRPRWTSEQEADLRAGTTSKPRKTYEQISKKVDHTPTACKVHWNRIKRSAEGRTNRKRARQDTGGVKGKDLQEMYVVGMKGWPR